VDLIAAAVFRFLTGALVRGAVTIADLAKSIVRNRAGINHVLIAMREKDGEMGKAIYLMSPSSVQVLLPLAGPVFAFLLMTIVAW
jgi:hypothetical protein